MNIYTIYYYSSDDGYTSTWEIYFISWHRIKFIQRSPFSWIRLSDCHLKLLTKSINFCGLIKNIWLIIHRLRQHNDTGCCTQNHFTTHYVMSNWAEIVINGKGDKSVCYFEVRHLEVALRRLRWQWNVIIILGSVGRESSLSTCIALSLVMLVLQFNYQESSMTDRFFIANNMRFNRCGEIISTNGVIMIRLFIFPFDIEQCNLHPRCILVNLFPMNYPNYWWKHKLRFHSQNL